MEAMMMKLLTKVEMTQPLPPLVIMMASGHQVRNCSRHMPLPHMKYALSYPGY